MIFKTITDKNIKCLIVFPETSNCEAEELLSSNFGIKAKILNCLNLQADDNDALFRIKNSGYIELP